MENGNPRKTPLFAEVNVRDEGAMCQARSPRSGSPAPSNTSTVSSRKTCTACCRRSGRCSITNCYNGNYFFDKLSRLRRLEASPTRLKEGAHRKLTQHQHHDQVALQAVQGGGEDGSDFFSVAHGG